MNKIYKLSCVCLLLFICSPAIGENESNILNSCVNIGVFDQDFQFLGNGSGVCIQDATDKRNLLCEDLDEKYQYAYIISTANHVVNPSYHDEKIQYVYLQFKIRHRNQYGKIIDTEIVGDGIAGYLIFVYPNINKDIAILVLFSVKKLPLVPLKMKNKSEINTLYVGQTVQSIGCPYGQEPIITKYGNIALLDVVRSVAINEYSVSFHRVNGANIHVARGSSGGAITDKEGRFLGIITMMRVDDHPWLAYFITLEQIYEFIESENNLNEVFKDIMK